MKEQFESFVEWCKQKGYKPSNGKALLEYVAEHPQA